MKKVYVIAILFYAIAIAGGFYMGANYKAKVKFGANDFNVITSSTYSKVTTSATLAQQLLPQNSARKYAVVSNSSDTGVFLTLGATTTATYQNGIWVPAGGSYVFDETNLYQGIVSVGTTTAGKVISATEAY